ncbi:hypothetical protein BVX95_01645 [archaeon D22]|nr:hypothetical protein BVX95_01645 [archaeon D22]
MIWKKIISREYSVQYCEIALNSISKKANHLIGNFYMKKPIILPRHKNQCFYFEEEERRKFISFITDEFTGSVKRFAYFKNLFKKLGIDYVNTCKKISDSNLQELNNQEIKILFLEYQQIAIDYTCIIWISFLLNEYWSERGRELVDKYDHQIREALFRPVKKSTVLIMQEEACKIKGNYKEIDKFWNKYKWISCLDLQNKPWSLKDVEDYISNLKIGDRYEKLDFQEALERAKLDNNKKEMFQMIKELGYIKDVRDDYRRKGIYFIQSLFAEISKRMNISLKEIAYLREEEILNFLDGKIIDLSNGKKRQEGFLLYLKDEKVLCFDQAISKELTDIGFREEESETSEIKGIVACKGIARGTVKIVVTVHDILKIKKGDILVAVTTHPDYVTAMQKSAAIVTDEGGILSHAAIVGRELGIPCIVGTNIATKVLQHGQIAEVDADKGVVKLIE